MEQSEIFLRVFVAILFGGIVGLESVTRELEKDDHALSKNKEKSRLGGVRTYTAVSLLGAIAGIFFQGNNPILAYILLIAVVLFVLAAYVLNVQLKSAFGLTTELAILITFTLGFGVTSNLLPLPVLLAILLLLTFFLSQKRGIGLLVQKIQHREVIDVLKFGLIAVVVLPFLPNRDFQLLEVANFLNIDMAESSLATITLINPFSVWLIVVIISGINLLSYVLSRLFGKNRGVFLSGILGGLISSTSSVVSFSSKTKIDEKLSNIYVSSALAANGISFITLILFAYVNNHEFGNGVFIPFLFMLLTSIALSVVIYIKNAKDRKNNFHVAYEPFSLVPAFKFVFLIVGIGILVQVLQILQVSNFLLIGVTALSGLSGMEAPLIAYSGLYSSGILTLEMAVAAAMLANAVNFVAKLLYAKVGGSSIFAVKLGVGLFITLIAGLIGLLL